MTEIFYYSGTGFTLKAARLIENELNGNVVLTPVVKAIKTGFVHSQAKKVGLLMPMHSFGIPEAFIRFLERASFPKANYVFSLVTRGGAPSKMHKDIGRALKRQGKYLDAFVYATTPSTFDIIQHIPLDDEVKASINNFEVDVKAFARKVDQNEHFIDIGYRNRLLEYVVFPAFRVLNRKTRYFNLENSFYTDENCISCGKCEAMCLSDKIKMRNGKPVWQKNIKCQFCLACLHLCPQKAVQIKKTDSRTLQRIFEKDVKLEDIIAQKI